MGEAKAWKISTGNYAAISSRGRRYAGLKSLAAARARVGLGTTRKKSSKPKKRASSKKVRKTTTKKGWFNGMSGLGLVEDAAIGLGGGAAFRLMGAGANAVPLARIAQGLSGYIFGRRGKKRLMYGIIDYVDNYLLSALGLGVRPEGKKQTGVFSEARQFLKLRS